MRKAAIFLCGILTAALVSGCGAKMPDMTQDEIDLISEYAVGVLLKYDKYHSSRLIDTSAYDVTDASETEGDAAEEQTTEEQEQTDAEAADDTETVDVSQDAEEHTAPSTIEEYYGIGGFTFRYSGYELQQSYPPAPENGDVYFSMDATQGQQLLVVRFMADNVSGGDRELDMMGYGADFRISVNGEKPQNSLFTMLLNDIETYSGTVPAGGSVELVSIIEVPESTTVDSLQLTMRGGEENAVMTLQ